VTPAEILQFGQIRESLPPLKPHDRDYVLAHAVALITSGIPHESAMEFNAITKIIIQFARRLAYCRWVEKQIAGKQQTAIITYEEWHNGQATGAR